jgi:hypothetical protein
MQETFNNNLGTSLRPTLTAHDPVCTVFPQGKITRNRAATIARWRRQADYPSISAGQ